MSYAPGIYIEERSSPSVSVRANATAVPVLVGVFLGKDLQIKSTREGCLRVESWLDFCEKFCENTLKFFVQSDFELSTLRVSEKDAIEDIESPVRNAISAPGIQKNAEQEYWIDISLDEDFESSALSVRHYFENGGGACYLLSISDRADAENIASEIVKCPDISLLVNARSDTRLLAAWDVINSEFAKVLERDKSCFAIASGKELESSQFPADLPADQVAFYYPYLATSYRYMFVDDCVWVETTSGDFWLSDLAAKAPKFYKEIRAELDTRLAEFKTPPPLPPGPAIAAAYCRNDRQRGVWKAPANIPLFRVTAPTVVLSDEERGALNEKGINVIRQTRDRGTVVYGARTLSTTDNWRYISVRRLFSAAERDIQKALHPFVFEPNSAITWERARAAVDTYLHKLWQDGALLGKTPQEAYFVSIGKNITMTEEDINDGKMILKIGMAAVRPAEFIILQFTQGMSDA